MRTYSKYYLLILIIISILQPGCKHDHQEEKTTKINSIAAKTVNPIAKKL